MTEELNQDPYHIDLMRTLWENTYRGTVFDYKEQYVATIRLILSIPLDRSEVPENAPKVNPSVIVLIEDTILSPLEVVEFEQCTPMGHCEQSYIQFLGSRVKLSLKVHTDCTCALVEDGKKRFMVEETSHSNSLLLTS